MRSLLLCIPFFLTACGHTYYVVRHAEKAVPSAGITMSTPNDPPLSSDGQQRAEALKEALKSKRISAIYATNTTRAVATAEPLRRSLSLLIQQYGPRPDSTFIQQLKAKRKNILIVGHSNTVDDIVNGLCNRKVVPGDLADSEYNHLYAVKYKRFFSTKIVFEDRSYGASKGGKFVRKSTSRAN